jgi:rubredoxin
MIRQSVGTTLLWECPDCAFAFDAAHVNDDSIGTYSCPVCNESKDTKRLDHLRKAGLIRVAGRDGLDLLPECVATLDALRQAIDDDMEAL